MNLLNPFKNFTNFIELIFYVKLINPQASPETPRQFWLSAY